jgi:NAD(P)-dependent dehydrogenase (short-subunit alcohol dehydrogenase family)
MIRNVLVSGATGGLGREVVALLLATGGHVTALHGSDPASADALRAHHPVANLDLYGVDLAETGAIAALAASLVDTREWDAFVHLAAPPLEIAPLGHQKTEVFERNWRVIAASGIRLTQMILPGMRRRGRGTLLFCLSAATLGAPPKGMAAYTSAKYALWGFARTIASECAGTGLRVLCFSPGAMDTPLLRNLPSVARDQLARVAPGGALADPATVARVAVALLDNPPDGIDNVPV